MADRVAEHPARPAFLVPFHHPVVWNIAPDETAKVAEPDRALCKAATGGNAFDRSVAQHQSSEPRVENFDVWVGIADRVRGHTFLSLLCCPCERRQAIWSGVS